VKGSPESQSYRDLHQRPRRARPNDRALHPPAHALPPLAARSRRRDRLHRQRDRSPSPPPRRTTACKAPPLAADGKHARVDGFVSLGVLASAAVVAAGLKLADPIIGLVITLVILHITWESWQTISKTDPGEMLDEHDH
jgi:hypothetical protein